VCGCVVAGPLPRFFLSLLSLAGLFLDPAGVVYYVLDVVWAIVYVATAVGTAYASLRPGRRT
jgi:hypothetical protein